MTEQRLNTTTTTSAKPTTGHHGSTVQAHLIGLGALAVAGVLFVTLDLSMEVGRGLFLAAIVIYAQFYNEATKHKADRANR